MQQLSIFDLTPNSEPTPLRYPNPRKARKLRELADSLQPQIDAKLNPAIASQRVTRRRANIVASMRQDGQQLQQIQSWLYGMADAAKEGTLPDILAQITTKTQLEVLWHLLHEKWSDSGIKRVFENESGNYTDWHNKLLRANIKNLSQVKRAIAALQSLHSRKQEDPTAVKIRELEHGLIGCDIRGYFPTPRHLCKQMVKLALLGTGMRVLEPSAGKGTLAEVIQEAAQVHLDVCEINFELRQILKLKGFNLVAFDFFDVTEKYDRILMNPPFGKAQEIKHIRHAYDCLNEGGRLVAIAPESITFRKDAVYREFREWLSNKCVLDEALPDGTFLDSERPTGVKTRLLVIEK